MVKNCQSWFGWKEILWIASSLTLSWKNFDRISTRFQHLPYGWNVDQTLSSNFVMSFQGLEFEYISMSILSKLWIRKKQWTRFQCLKLIRRSIDLVSIGKISENLVDLIFLDVSLPCYSICYLIYFIISWYKIVVLSRANFHAQNENVISCSIATHLIPMTL